MSLALVIFIGVALLGKIIGGGVGAKLAGMSGKDSLKVGVGMMPRMEVALVVIAAAMANPNYMAGGHADQILVMTILLVVVSTIVTPFMIKAAMSDDDESWPR